MNKPTLLVTRRIFPDVVERLRQHFVVRWHDSDRALGAAQLREHLQGCDAVFVATTEVITADLIATCPQLKAVCSMAVGVNNIDIEACTARGVMVSNAPNVLTETTADFGFALMMAAARRVPESERFLRAGQWTQWSMDLFAGADIYGRTLGILGMGRIGQAVARRGVHGFGMSLLYHNRSRLAPEQETALKAEYVSKAELLIRADHVVIVVPYTPQTHHLVGTAELALMKPTATLTNIARGGVVDDAALASALAERQIAAAGIDVFEGEPKVHPDLLAAPNAVLTPHIASASLPTRLAMCNLAADNLIAAFTGGQPLTVLNPQVLPLKWRG
ncbi:MAG: D-glycerate dehydrogenase [Ideonella sp.]|nr:D-glycerate dehydrogenase [Ideonella sp.]